MAQFKRSIVIINKPFQYKFSIMLSSLVLLSSLAYPALIYGVFENLINNFVQDAAKIESLKSQVLTWLITFQVIFTAIVFVIGIFFSHKIAGPMYKLTNHLKKLQSGNELEEVHFRSGDYFQEVAEELNNLLNYLKNREIQDVKYIKEVNSFLNNISLVMPEDKKPVIHEITSKLSEIESRHSNIN